MVKIIEVLGPLSEEDVSFVTFDEPLEYIQIMQKVLLNENQHQSDDSLASGNNQVERHFSSKFDQLFEGVSPSLQHLLRQMLEFNPKKRITVAEALQSAVFDSIRVPYYESACPVRISHKIFEPGAFDYESGKKHRYSLRDYKKMLLREVAKVGKKYKK